MRTGCERSQQEFLGNQTGIKWLSLSFRSLSLLDTRPRDRLFFVVFLYIVFLHSIMSHVDSSGLQLIEPPILTSRRITEPHHTDSLSTTEQSILSSNPHSISRTISLSRTNLTQENERDQTLKKLESIVETLRGGNATKTSTIASILGILKTTPMSHSANLKRR